MRRHELPALPYTLDALEPYISRETLHFHYSKHHKNYVDTLNRLLQQPGAEEFSDASLDDIVLRAHGAIFNNGAQAWNHAFLWKCMTPVQRTPDERIRSALDNTFGSLRRFQEKFNEAALSVFGSGYAWLILRRDGKLGIEITHNAMNPLRTAGVPLLVCDVWEHAYYLDHRNDRAAFMNSYFPVVNWEFVSSRLKDAAATSQLAA